MQLWWQEALQDFKVGGSVGGFLNTPPPNTHPTHSYTHSHSIHTHTHTQSLTHISSPSNTS